MDELLNPPLSEAVAPGAAFTGTARPSKNHHISLQAEGDDAPPVSIGRLIYHTLDALEPEGLRHYRRIKGRISASWSASQSYHALDRFMTALCALLKKPAVIPVFFLLAALCLAAGVSNTVYTTGYAVTVNGTVMGTVSDYTVIDNIVDQVENKASEILGYDYTLDTNISYDFVVTERTKVTDSIPDLETYLFSQVGEVMKRYVITVDGKAIGAVTDRSQLEDVLDQIAAPYINENTTSYSFAQDVSISYDYVSSSVPQDIDEIASILTSNSTEAVTYTVQSGDTYYDLAWNNDMSLDDLMNLNPNADIDTLMPGDLLTLTASVPFLTVKTTENVTYTETIACPVEEVDDSSMYEGESKVITAGVPGSATVNADVTYQNGIETDRSVLSYTVISEATTEVIAVGTKEKPTWIATGSFRWPVSGSITSYFGYRSVFGSYSYHSGIDIATSYGTAIVASDGGTVIWSGYKGTYGNLVIVDHGNGYQTYYAHCSSLLVSVGDKVYKGQTIARVGSTGRSTGNHCHFEVRYNGTAYNPLSYLP